MSRQSESMAELERQRSGEHSPYRENRSGTGPTHNEIDGFHGPGSVNRNPRSPAPEKGSLPRATD